MRVYDIHRPRVEEEVSVMRRGDDSTGTRWKMKDNDNVIYSDDICDYCKHKNYQGAYPESMRSVCYSCDICGILFEGKRLFEKSQPIQERGGK